MQPHERSPFATILTLLAVLTLASAVFVHAQVRIVGAISGTVLDSSGALVPGAKVTLKDESTGVTRTTTATAQGSFYFPDLSHGEYSVTVVMTGFQTSVTQKITVETSQTADIQVRLTVGEQAQTVTVEGAAAVLETTSNLVANTITQQSIQELPILNRSVLAFAQLVPGQVTPRNSNVSGADTHYNNMPGGAVNVTTDGINNASNGFKSGGTVFYTTVPGRYGAIEEVSVETGGLGADAGAQSGTNVKFVTRRGTSQYHGSAFYQPTSELFNANTWLRNAQGQGFRVRSRNHNSGLRLLQGQTILLRELRVPLQSPIDRKKPDCAAAFRAIRHLQLSRHRWQSSHRQRVADRRCQWIYFGDQSGDEVHPG